MVNDQRMSGILGQYTRPSFHTQAACRPSGNGDERLTDLFYPEAWDDVSRDAGRAICASCPVQVECLTWALDNRDDTGYRAGVSPAAIADAIRRGATAESLLGR